MESVLLPPPLSPADGDAKTAASRILLEPYLPESMLVTS